MSLIAVGVRGSVSLAPPPRNLKNKNMPHGYALLVHINAEKHFNSAHFALVKKDNKKRK